MQDGLATHLEARYAAPVKALVRLDGDVFRVDRGDGDRWVARVFPESRPVEQIEGDAAVLAALEAQGYPAERCAHPEPVSTFDGKSVLVTRHVDGAMVNGDPTTYRRLGALLGQLHALPCEPGPASRVAGALHHWVPQGGGPGEDVAVAQSWLAEIEPRVASPHRAQYESLLELLAHLDDGKALPHAFVHPDFHRGNVLATDDDVVVIDWTGAGRGPRVASLGVLLFTAAAKQYPGDATSSPDVERVGPVVAGYRSQIGLDADELAHLDDAVLRPALVFACYLFWVGVRSSGQPALSGPWAPPYEMAGAIASRARAAFEQASS
jgi:Ser/Thr protein kinase RdoA (MazF antagonist)